MSAVRTTCPFCLNGCESIVTSDYQFRMEYPQDAAVNKGRLCPRGNSASIVVDHPKRLAYPLLDGKEVSWDHAMQYMSSAMAAAKPAHDIPWGLYLVDVFDNMQLLKQVDKYALFEPIPLRKTPRPPAIPDRVDLNSRTSVCFIQGLLHGPGCPVRIHYHLALYICPPRNSRSR